VALFSGVVLPSSSAKSLPQAATQPQAAKSVVYKNKRYGFAFSLPGSWKGYSILPRQWSGTPINDASGVKEECGPILIIRHPLWTEAEPREDIPIMVFTHRQWQEVQSRLAVSAAPFPPSEIGRNAKWVFGLPPRYNYDFLTGFEEVEQILQGSPLRAF
jgi:hypothetical protein